MCGVVNHVKSKHRLLKGETLMRAPEGPHIEAANDLTVQREIDFGFIRISINGNNPDETDWAGEIACRIRGDVFFSRGRIVWHIA